MSSVVCCSLGKLNVSPVFVSSLDLRNMESSRSRNTAPCIRVSEAGAGDDRDNVQRYIRSHDRENLVLSTLGLLGLLLYFVLSEDDCGVVVSRPKPSCETGIYTGRFFYDTSPNPTLELRRSTRGTAR